MPNESPGNNPELSLRDYTFNLHKEVDQFFDWYFLRYNKTPAKKLFHTEESWDELYDEFLNEE